MWITLTTFNRIEKTMESIEMLLKTNFPSNTNLIITDDRSTDKGMIDYLSEVSKRNIPNLKIELILHGNHLGCDKNITNAIYYCLSRTKDHFILVLDNDTIYGSGWLDKLLEIGDKLLRENKPIAAISVFNASRTHGFIGKYNDEIGIKSSLGGFCVLINRILFETYDFRTPLWKMGWDWNMCHASEELKLSFYCTYKSWVDHMRGWGTHGSDGDNGENFIGV